MTESGNQPTNLDNQKLQVEMARTRTVLALERTLLAWIRTSLTLVAFGFTLAKFVGGLVKQGHIQGIAAQDLDSPRNLGLMMMILGVLGLAGGTVSYFRSAKRLESTQALISAPFLTAIVLGIITICLVVLLVLKEVP